MKKLSLILAGALLLGGISFASPVAKQDAKAPVAKQSAKPAAKATKAIPTKGAKSTPASKGTKGTKKAPAHKVAPVKNITK